MSLPSETPRGDEKQSVNRSHLTPQQPSHSNVDSSVFECIIEVFMFITAPGCFQDSQVRQSTTYSLHQPQGNKEHGTERSGYLYKKSDG